MGLPKDEYGNTVQVVTLGPVAAVESVATTTGGSVSSAAIGFGTYPQAFHIVRLECDQDAYVCSDTSPVATSSATKIFANTPENFAVKSGNKIAALAVSSGGTLKITKS